MELNTLLKEITRFISNINTPALQKKMFKKYKFHNLDKIYYINAKEKYKEINKLIYKNLIIYGVISCLAAAIIYWQYTVSTYMNKNSYGVEFNSNNWIIGFTIVIFVIFNVIFISNFCEKIDSNLYSSYREIYKNYKNEERKLLNRANPVIKCIEYQITDYITELESQKNIIADTYTKERINKIIKSLKEYPVVELPQKTLPDKKISNTLVKLETLLP